MNPSDGLTLLTRIGFAARGLLYIVIASLLIRMGRTEDPSGALDYVARDGGSLLLLAMTGGFIAYGVWRLSDALFNVEGHEQGKTGMRERLGAGGSGVVHLLLAWQAIRLMRGGPSDDGGSQESAQTALSLPGGQLLLLLAGLVLIGVGVFQIIKAFKGGYLKHLEARIASQPWAKWMGRAGYSARGLVFLISGFFVLKAGLADKASEAGGIEEALSWLDRPWDSIVAAGLLAFGLYSLVEARFRILHGLPTDLRPPEAFRR